MPIDTCASTTCGKTFAIGLFRCPRCQTIAPRYAAAMKEEDMPRTTIAAGPTNAGAVEGEVGFIKPEAADDDVEQPPSEHGPELVDLPTGATVKAVGDWSSLSLSALRDEARGRGLASGGSKADLATRLTDHDAEQASAATETDPEETPA